MQNHEDRQRAKTFAIVAGTFVVHQFVATLGTIATASELAALPFQLFRIFGRPVSAHYFHWILTQTPYFPVQALLALILGWLFSQPLRYRVMFWVWVLPCGILCYALVAIPNLFPALTAQVPQPSQTPFSHYFGYGCRPENHCIDQLAITLPFYTSVAYSMGALMAQRIAKNLRVIQSRSWVALMLALVILAAVMVDTVLSLKQGVRWVYGLIEVIPITIAFFLARIAFKAEENVAPRSCN
ncbi:MAG: hypothetical protein ACRD37_02735 [Candidatus Acidiferrales bacterium]